MYNLRKYTRTHYCWSMSYFVNLWCDITETVRLIIVLRFTGLCEIKGKGDKDWEYIQGRTFISKVGRGLAWAWPLRRPP